MLGGRGAANRHTHMLAAARLDGTVTHISDTASDSSAQEVSRWEGRIAWIGSGGHRNRFATAFNQRAVSSLAWLGGPVTSASCLGSAG